MAFNSFHLPFLIQILLSAIRISTLIFYCFHLYLVSASPMQGTRLVLIIGALFYFLSLCACQVTPFSRCSRPFENLDDALFV